MAIEADLTHLVAMLGIVAGASAQFHEWRLIAHLKKSDPAYLKKFGWAPMEPKLGWFFVRRSSNFFLPGTVSLRLLFKGLPYPDEAPPNVRKNAVRRRWSLFAFLLLWLVVVFNVMADKYG